MALGKPIPGETPIEDISELLVKRISTRAELAICEAENIRKAMVKYLSARPSRRKAPFDYAWGLRLHKEMFGQVWGWAGKVTMEDRNLGVPWQQVQPRLFELFKDLRYWKATEVDFTEQATMLHHKAVHIHPFANGNGRWARLLANIWLKMNRHPITEWPETTVGAQSTIREAYLQAIKAADEGDYALLLELHRQFAAKA
jgi:Fic-DOC domain mobile mystery protein B